MPQLMPLYWGLSFLMVICIVMVMICMYLSFNNVNFDGFMNLFSYKKMNWLW